MRAAAEERRVLVPFSCPHPLATIPLSISVSLSLSRDFRFPPHTFRPPLFDHFPSRRPIHRLGGPFALFEQKGQTKENKKT